MPTRNPWLDYIPRGRVPENSLLHFGADPGHTPAREGYGQSSRRAAQPIDTCTECGGPLNPDDPIHTFPIHVTDHLSSKKQSLGAARLEPLIIVCGGCGRSDFDATPAMSHAVKTTVCEPIPLPPPVVPAPGVGGKLTRRERRLLRFSSQPHGKCQSSSSENAGS